jgi:hypothetical protein
VAELGEHPVTTALPPFELVNQPRVHDIRAGRPYRLVTFPADIPSTGMTDVSYWLEVLANSEYGSSVLFGVGPEPLPTFELTGQQTAQLGTILAAANPRGYDSIGEATSIGWYRVWAQGTNPSTTEAVTTLSGHGPLIVRLNEQLTRKDRILLGQGTCGCASASTCGCATGCSTCDHPLPTDDLCNVLTKRAATKGRWRGNFSDLDPPDNLGPYVRMDVIQMPDGTQYVYLGPADGRSLCMAPGEGQP